jgi:hypothetical protein
MYPWQVRLQLERNALKMLIEDPEGDALKARLPVHPCHPRALLTLLEGAALWSGMPICAAICAGARSDRSLVAGLFGDDFVPIESALVQYEFVDPPTRRRRRRLSGVGDFRQLYLFGRSAR